MAAKRKPWNKGRKNKKWKIIPPYARRVRGIFGIDASKVPWVALGVGALVLLGFSKAAKAAKDFSEAFDLGKDDPLVVAAQGSPWWSANYTQGKAFWGLTEASANQYAEAIYKADGYVWNDFNTIIATFKKLSYKSQVSELVKRFEVKYGKDLLNYITSFIGGGDEMVRTVLTYTNSLPSGLV